MLQPCRLRLSLLSVLILMMLMPVVAAGQEAGTWELRGGRWQRVEGTGGGAAAAAAVPDETLDRVEEMLRNRQASTGRRTVIAWLKAHGAMQKPGATAAATTVAPNVPNRDRAVYLLGMANYLAGDRVMAFYNFDEVLDLYPASRYFYPSLEQQYEIADAFLRGFKREFLGMRILSATTEAVEMLYRIQQRAPGSPVAEKALLRTADYYYASSQFDLAALSYAAYIRSYPRSPYLARVRLRQAFSALAQFRGVRFDATPVVDARQQLMDLAVAYPRVAEEENIGAILRRIDTTLARKVLATADLYRRTGKPRAAAYYYRYVQASYPESAEAASAGRQLGRLPEWAVEEAGVPGGATSRPSGGAPAGGAGGATPADGESR